MEHRLLCKPSLLHYIKSIGVLIIHHVFILFDLKIQSNHTDFALEMDWIMACLHKEKFC